MLKSCVLVISCVSMALGCGSGPSGGEVVSSVEGQHIPASDGQRIPPADPQLADTRPQAVATTDPESVPPGSQFTSGAGPQNCEQFCMQYEGLECEVPDCRELCEVLPKVTSACASALLITADCYASDEGNCQEHRQACNREVAASLVTDCGNQLEGKGLGEASADR
jgi:hypothetical protein